MTPPEVPPVSQAGIYQPARILFPNGPHAYGYAKQNPLGKSDFTGLSPKDNLYGFRKHFGDGIIDTKRNQAIRTLLKKRHAHFMTSGVRPAAQQDPYDDSD
jgi:hypothetical protein